MQIISYWFGTWSCGCTDIETSPLLILEFCPTHGCSLVSDDAGRTKVELDRRPISGLGFKSDQETLMSTADERHWDAVDDIPLTDATHPDRCTPSACPECTEEQAERDRERLLSHTDQSGECWLWTARISPVTGYGQAWYEGTNRLAHRAVYTALVGPIPEGLQLDHLCRVRHCVNPEHLEPVTPWTNTMRGNTITAANAVKTHCPKGHEYNSSNTYVSRSGKRHCKTCKLAWQKTPEGRAAWNAWYARNKSREAAR